MARVIQEDGVWILRDDWDFDDVRNAMEGETLTDDDCLNIFNMIAQSFDANDGINWEVIQAVADIYLEEKND
jgi:hypothetical protein